MLCPEVWNLNSPSNSVVVCSGFPSDLDHCEKLINQHYYNHNVSVVLPECPKIPEDLAKELKNDCDYYKVNLPVTQLIEKNFVNLFIKSGELTALSVGTRIDVDDCVCVTPTGILVLSLLRETYQKLGIEGNPWTNSPAKPERYAVNIDLKKDCFLPGKANYDRVYKSFSQFLPLQFDFILAWEPPEEKGICPSSIASYLHAKGHDIRLCEPVFSYKNECNVPVPQLMTTNPDEFIEWLGAFSLGILQKESDISSESLEYLSSYEPPFSCELAAQVLMLQWTGFFTYKKLLQLFSKLWDYISAEGRIKMPWVSLSTIGFSDSPCSWGLTNNSFHTSGDNNYSIVIKPQKHLITFKITPRNVKTKKKHKKWVYIEHNSK